MGSASFPGRAAWIFTEPMPLTLAVLHFRASPFNTVKAESIDVITVKSGVSQEGEWMKVGMADKKIKEDRLKR